MFRRLYLFLTGLLYHQLAWAYDGVAALVSAGQWKQWALSIVPDLTGKRILELGHGPGHLQAALLEKDIQVIGLDKSPQMSRQANRRLQKRDFKKRPGLVHGDANYLPFADESFDQVVATFPTNYMTAGGTLSEVYRVLSPAGGLVVIPGARLTAPRGLAERLASGIFRLFGLAQDWSELAREWFVMPIQRAGFSVSVERRPFKSGEIFVIMGKKG
jgi:ubiquinone/menaquinone biosynthesis C-methylase UbiE